MTFRPFFEARSDFLINISVARRAQVFSIFLEFFLKNGGIKDILYS